MFQSASHSKSLIFRPGATFFAVSESPNGLILDCPMPWLAGPRTQILAEKMSMIDVDGSRFLHNENSLAGVLIGEGLPDLEEETFRLYHRIFRITDGMRLLRIWNFVPNINGISNGSEQYVIFNSGRHRAFSEKFGAIRRQDLSAASAVGTHSDRPAVAFVASSLPVEHFENPLQTPSAQYPECYGKRAPLFARASCVQGAAGPSCWHLSGTASIRSSETIVGDIMTQLEITLENIRRLMDLMELPAHRQATWKIFLRHRHDLPVCKQRLAEEFPADLDFMMFVEADICRRDLLLEIEGIFHPAYS